MADLYGKIVRFQFSSKLLKNERGISIWLPPGYENSQQKYPVIYFHDGQNIFDPMTSASGIAWGADVTATRLIGEGRMRPAILVAINNTKERISEYTLHPEPMLNVSEAKGREYGEFLFTELKPFIDSEFHTLTEMNHTGVIGSSMGGLISLSLAWTFPDRVGMCGVLSPSLWWSKGILLKELHGKDFNWMKRKRFWLDMGTREGPSRAVIPPGIVRTRKLAETFDKAGLIPGKDYYYQEIVGGEHNEAHWAARLDKVLMFLLSS